jgi:hypothetical protein
MSGSFLTTGRGAFLKLGNLGFGFGAEKNDESDLASLTAGMTGFTSFLTTLEDALDTVGAEGVVDFFAGGGAFAGGGSFSFRFLFFVSVRDTRQKDITNGLDTLHPQNTDVEPTFCNIRVYFIEQLTPFTFKICRHIFDRWVA